MTRPTQAQIEAAAKAAFDYDVRNSRTTAQWDNARRFYLELCKYALTAAARIGEPNKTPASRKLLNMTEAMWQNAEKECREIEAAAIERCKQVALQIRNCDYQSMLKIADAIDKLKDES